MPRLNLPSLLHHQQQQVVRQQQQQQCLEQSHLQQQQQRLAGWMVPPQQMQLVVQQTHQGRTDRSFATWVRMVLPLLIRRWPLLALRSDRQRQLLLQQTALQQRWL